MPSVYLRRVLHRTAVLAVLAGVAAAHAGGSPENALLIVDPASPDGLYIANYYRHARQVPEANVLYTAPGAANFAEFADKNLDALFGHLANAGIGDHIDYIVVMPGSPFYVNASGLVADGCSPVTRFSIGSAYTFAFVADEILTGTLAYWYANRYFSNADTPTAFDSLTAWLNGEPSTSDAARRYFIGAMLGYTGERGNTPAELVTLIDRSVAVDGTFPAGTFYFMNNTSDPARNVRYPQYNTVKWSLWGLGASATIPSGVLPPGGSIAVGIMTGAASPAIDTWGMTVRPGAFCDHLTSYAAKFDEASQTKVSRWIVKGASASFGTVDEPCNYTGKFPHARAHVYIYQGASLGEAALRSVEYAPFQGLIYGDPLTRPFAHLPAVTLSGVPGGPAGGVITLTPSATTTHPTATIAGYELLIDGRSHGTAVPGGSFTIDTATLSDGWHDLRVLAWDNSPARSTGRWIGSLTTANVGRSVTLSAPASGDLATALACAVSASGAGVEEVRLVHNGRVVAAAPGASATLTVHGRMLGAGPARLFGEAYYGDGRVVRSAPQLVTLATTAVNPSNTAPVAFGFRKRLLKNQPCVLELPATQGNPATTLTYEIVTPPTKTTVVAGPTSGWRLLRPLASASGRDSLAFRVTSAAGTSNTATVELIYDVEVGRPGDLNCDGAVNFDDIDPFVVALSGQAGYEAAYPGCRWLNADCNGDGLVNFDDIDAFVALVGS